MRLLCGAITLLAFCSTLTSQTGKPTAKPPALFPTRPAAPVAPKNYPQLKPYESCDFPDGLLVTDVTNMPADVHDRPAVSHGETKNVPLLSGRRILFAYPGQQPYANVKLELLPAENYAANRKLLLDDFDDIAASDKNVARNLARKSTQSGFSVVGLDKKTMGSETLGIYLLLDDATHTAATVYFLDPTPGKSMFKTPAEYAQKRDTFLYNYTRCIRNNQNGSMFGAQPH